MTVLALPILLIENIPRTDVSANVKVAATVTTVTTSTTPTTLAPSTTVEPTTAPPTTAAPATAPPTTAAKAKAAAPPTTARPTTTTAPPPPTTAALYVAPAPANTESGDASWYDYRPGECAHKSIARGTVVHVTNRATGASTSCVVTDRGPYAGGRIIDLDRSTFAQIADPGAGVIQVTITW
jgi:rare lipoprotein A (peptidoglycan hydrolase)